jgi:hypothetical protein
VVRIANHRNHNRVASVRQRFVTSTPCQAPHKSSEQRKQVSSSIVGLLIPVEAMESQPRTGSTSPKTRQASDSSFPGHDSLLIQVSSSSRLTGVGRGFRSVVPGVGSDGNPPVRATNGFALPPAQAVNVVVSAALLPAGNSRTASPLKSLVSGGLSACVRGSRAEAQRATCRWALAPRPARDWPGASGCRRCGITETYIRAGADRCSLRFFFSWRFCRRLPVFCES